MKPLLAALCLSLTSCESLWLSAYRYQGGGYERQKSSLPVAADQLKRLTVSPQPTYH